MEDLSDGHGGQEEGVDKGRRGSGLDMWKAKYAAEGEKVWGCKLKRD